MTMMLIAALFTLQDTGVVSGKANFAGDPPRRKPVKLDPQCAECNPGPQPLREDLIVNPDKQIKNVVVFVSSKVEGKFEPVTTTVEVDQKGCIYKPHVIAVRANQPIEFKNSDPMMHNVHGMGGINPEFNVSIRAGGKETRKLLEAEVGYKVKCDVHPWMLLYVHIFQHPFFTLTGDDGSFEIKGLPAGEHELTFWHEKLGEKKVKVKIESGKTATQDITFEQP